MKDNNIYKNKFSSKEEKFSNPSSRKYKTKLKFRVACKKSINEKSLYFTNKLKFNELNNLVNTQVFKILNIDGKEYDLDNSPIDDIEKLDFLENNKDKTRVPAILNIYGEIFEDNTILKCTPHSSLGHRIASKGIKCDRVRLYVKKDINEEWVVILIDPNHLLAEENYVADYERYKNNQYSFEQLKSPY